MLHDRIIIFLLVIYAAAAEDPYHITIHCGGDAHGGRHWLREGSSTVSTAKGGLITARISGSRFSYSLKLIPGQKILRLHFHPSSYNGFESSNDLFSVEAGNSSLLANFSASVTARALTVNVIVKQFRVTVEENETFNIAFSPELGNSYYAFVNEIEIISIPSTTLYSDDEVAPNPIIHVENSTALERVHYQHVKWGPVSSGDDIASMFGMWSNQPHVGEDAEIGTNKTWRVSVDAGFKYLVRLHLCEAGLHMDFVLLINGRVALTSADMHQQRRGNRELFWYNNYMLMDEELKQGDISVSLHSRHEFMDRHGPLEGFEVFKMSSHQSDCVLIQIQDSSLLTLLHSQIYSILFHICCIVFLVYLQHKLSHKKFTREDNKPLSRENQLSNRFSLARILGICGYGGDGNRFVDYGREIVVIKPLKMDFNQRENKFWNVIEALWGLRHVSLIGHCREQQGVAGHLYKLARKINNIFPKSWKQRLQICVEVGQALEYLHTGPMVHRDLKPANILLDDKFVARLADFGVAKTVSISKSQRQDSTKLIGTHGYIAPDFITSGEGTKHIDIYSIGAVLLEVLIGRAGREPRTKVEDVDYDKIDFGNHEEVELEFLMDSLTDSQKQQLPPGFEFYPTDTELVVYAMKRATRNFRSDLVLGEGGFGSVYKRFMNCESDQYFREWQSEVNFVGRVVKLLGYCHENQQLLLGRLSHLNLLKLLGYGGDDNELLLFYKWMPNVRFENHLFQSRRVACYADTKARWRIRNSCGHSVLGGGGFGMLVAIKKSNHQNSQGFREWKSEVQFLRRLSHPNLVKLFGYCLDDNELFLVYEYMPKGSLENHPFQSYGQPLPWDTRIKILIGASRGLQNLHSSDTKVIYRDFKSSKILLDKSYNAKISDFGLATTGPFADKTPVSARIMGTFGYTEPEYIMTGHVNVKSDVYGFGVLLLEVLTGLQAIDQRRGGEQQNLVVCMKLHLSDQRKMINQNKLSWMICGIDRAMHAVEVPVIYRDFKASNILLDDVKLGVLMDSSTSSHQWQIDRRSIAPAVIEQPSITAAPTPAKKQVQRLQQTEHYKAHVPAQAPARSDWSKQKRDVEIEVEWSGVEIINNILLSIV